MGWGGGGDCCSVDEHAGGGDGCSELGCSLCFVVCGLGVFGKTGGFCVGMGGGGTDVL